MALNSFITDKNNGMGKKEDKQVGQFFVDFNSSLVADSHSTVAAIAGAANQKINKLIRNKLLIYLWQDVQGINTMQNTVSLFDKKINSYDDLYRNFGNDKVFSDEFINNFLTPSLTKYPY